MQTIEALDVGLILFLAGHLGTAIWFGSSMNTKMGFIFEKIKDIESRMSKMLHLQERIAVTELEVHEVKRRLDELESLR